VVRSGGFGSLVESTVRVSSLGSGCSGWNLLDNLFLGGSGSTQGQGTNGQDGRELHCYRWVEVIMPCR
jgi:hypothetical protein